VRQAQPNHRLHERRRETRPALTCSSSLRISCSSIGASATYKTRTRVLRCESSPEWRTQLLRRRLMPTRKSITRGYFAQADPRNSKSELPTACQTARTLATRRRGFARTGVREIRLRRSMRGGWNGLGEYRPVLDPTNNPLAKRRILWPLWSRVRPRQSAGRGRDEQEKRRVGVPPRPGDDDQPA